MNLLVLTTLALMMSLNSEPPSEFQLLKTVNDAQLNLEIADEFSSEIDVVEILEILQDKDGQYYFGVTGSKDASSVYFKVLIDAETAAKPKRPRCDCKRTGRAWLVYFDIQGCLGYCK